MKIKRLKRYISESLVTMGSEHSNDFDAGMEYAYKHILEMIEKTDIDPHTIYWQIDEKAKLMDTTDTDCVGKLLTDNFTKFDILELDVTKLEAEYIRFLECYGLTSPKTSEGWNSNAMLPNNLAFFSEMRVERHIEGVEWDKFIEIHSRENGVQQISEGLTNYSIEAHLLEHNTN